MAEDKDEAEDEALTSLLQDAFPLAPTQEQESWQRFQGDTRPDKTAWLRFAAVMERSDRQVKRIMTQANTQRLPGNDKRATYWL